MSVEGVPPCDARWAEDGRCLDCGATWHCAKCGRACNMQGSGHENDEGCREQSRRRAAEERLHRSIVEALGLR